MNILFESKACQEISMDGYGGANTFLQQSYTIFYFSSLPLNNNVSLYFAGLVQL